MNIGFKTKIFLSFGILIGLSLAVLSYFNYSSSKKNVTNYNDRQQFIVVKNLQEKIDGWIEDKKVVLSAFSKSISNYDSHIDIDIIAKQLTLAKESANLELLFAGYEDGSVVYHDKRVKKNYDPRARPWYKGAMSTQEKVYVSPPYIGSSSGKLLITFASKIHDVSGRVVGVLGGDISLDAIRKSILNISLPQNGYTVLLDKKLTVLIGPKDKLKKPFLGNLGLMKQADRKNILSRKNYKFSVDKNGVEKVLFSSPLDSVKWIVSIALDEDVVYQDVNTAFVNSMILLLIFIAISLFLMWLILKYAMEPMNRLLATVKDLSGGEGDLTQRLEISGNDIIAQISSEINLFIEKIQNLIKKVNSGSSENVTIANELSSTASAVIKMTENQTDLVSKATTASSSISNTLNATSQITKVNREKLEGTSKNLNSLCAQMNELNAMLQSTSQKEKEIADKLNQVSSNANDVKEVLTIIGDIADQTNLLALNAAIEAARAGEHGRGFAVVADEVRKLAERTQKSLVEINATINVVVQSIADANNDMMETSEDISKLSSSSITINNSLDKSVEVMEDNLKTTKENMSSYLEVTNKIEQLSKNLKEISAISQDSSNSSMEVGKASTHLSNLADELNHTISYFKIQ